MDSAPKLDTRTYEEVVAQTEALATAYTSVGPGSSWRPRADGTLDLGGTLIRLFGTMMGHLIKQLNAVPDKHRQAFTALLAANRTPAQPARAPLTFVLDDGTRTSTVPAGAQIAGVNAAGKSVVFETEFDLPLTRARLEAVFVRDVANARYADRSPRARGEVQLGYSAFAAEPPRDARDDALNRAIEHEIYVELAPLSERGATSVTVVAAASSALPAERVQWAGFRDGSFADLPAVTVSGNTWRLSALASLIGPTEVQGKTARWLRATVPASTPPLRVTADVGISVTAAPLETVVANGQPVDFTRDVLPFGERPRSGDVVYFGNDDAFALNGVTVTLTLALTIPPAGVNASGDLKLIWEAWDGKAAKTIGESTPNSTGTSAFTDTTKALTVNGSVTFKLATAIPRSVVRGTTSRWLRARIVAGNYGVDMTATSAATFRPPAISGATWTWSGTVATTPAHLVRRTALTFEDVAGAAEQPVVVYRDAPELTYQSSVDTLPSLHLGFDRAFESTLTTLYVQVLNPPSPAPSDYVQPPPPLRAARVTWEYWNGTEWAKLEVEDGSESFAQSGLVRFHLPADARPLTQFGRSLHWTRARLLEPSPTPMPRLQRLLLNTVWASNAHTYVGEVLGSSNGMRDQSFQLTGGPVLEGYRIEVGEPEAPPRSDVERLDPTHADSAVSVEVGTDRRATYWVRWSPVADFWASGPRDRHYTIDLATGRVSFGDGVRGMIPPRGTRNVRAAWYRAGGGEVGNVASGALTQLKTTVPGVTAVLNHEAAVGGAELESQPAMTARASRALRHGGRAVTAEDYADLALEASTAIARAVALTPSFVPIEQGAGPDTGPDALQRDGRVIVVIVPATLLPGTAPALDVLSAVQAFLRARSAPGARVDVIGPSWVAVDIVVHLATRSLASADEVLAEARSAIAQLFDPLQGGDGAGWPFGRRPRESDVVARIGSIDGIDHVSYVRVRCEAPFDEDDTAPGAREISVDELSLRSRLLVYARSITVSLPQPVPA